MDQRKLLPVIYGMGVFLSCTSIAQAADYNYSMNPNGKNTKDLTTDKVTIFEQEDEIKLYTDHGFTRGDLTTLYKSEFDPSTIETVSGTVSKVLRVQFPDNDCYLIAVIQTKANNGEIAINLGPVWFLEENNIAVNEGNTLQVVGSKIRMNGRYLIIATEISKNGTPLNLRDKDGSPLWGMPKNQKGNADCMKLPNGMKAKK